MIDTYLIIVNILLVAVTFFSALLQYRLSHAPLIRVIKRRHKISRKEGEGAYYEITIENSGKISSLDAFLLIKEVRKKRKINGEKINNNYYLSKPVRIIEVGEKVILHVKTGKLPKNYKDVLFGVVYMDHFGKKYLASDVMNGEIIKRKEKYEPNKHLEMFAKKSVLLSWWRFRTWKFYIWKRKAIKSGNTLKGFVERIEKKEDRLDEINLRKIVEEFNKPR